MLASVGTNNYPVYCIGPRPLALGSSGKVFKSGKAPESILKMEQSINYLNFEISPSSASLQLE